MPLHPGFKTLLLSAPLTLSAFLFSHHALSGVNHIFIQPDFGGLNITYYQRKNDHKVTLYVFNHEKHTVLCDSEYRSGPEKRNQPEKTIAPGKGISYAFRFGRSAEKARVMLKCIPQKTDAEKALEATPATTDETDDSSSPTKKKTRFEYQVE